MSPSTKNFESERTEISFLACATQFYMVFERMEVLVKTNLFTLFCETLNHTESQFISQFRKGYLWVNLV